VVVCDQNSHYPGLFVYKKNKTNLLNRKITVSALKTVKPCNKTRKKMQKIGISLPSRGEKTKGAEIILLLFIM
jgi:hypothetical protein